MDRPGSARIAAELRERIAAGDLRPGAKLPSTRALMVRYGVAMATATKALAELKHAGLITAVPGVGTVVATPQRRTSRSGRDATGGGRAVPAALRPDAVVTAAIGIADTEGLSALSMRRLATTLQSSPMSLYRHVQDKDDLLLQMIDAAIAELELPDPGPAQWRDAVELAARAMWAGFRRHPWLPASLSLTRPQVVPHAIAYTEWVLRELHRAGLGPLAAFQVHLTVFTYTRGTALNLEWEADQEAVTGLTSDEWMAGQGPCWRSC